MNKLKGVVIQSSQQTRCLLQQSKTLAVISTWVGVYPLLTLIALLIEPLIIDEALFIRTLAMSVVMVPIMVLLIMPIMNKIMKSLASKTIKQLITRGITR